MMDPSLIDSSALSRIPPDVTFKFPKSGGGEIEAHKTVLAMVSDVFGNMIFVLNTKDKSATEMVLEDTTKPPFQIMLDAIYNVKSMKESLQGKSVDEMFVSKYEIPKLLVAVKESISSFPITEDNVLEVATAAMEYLTTFEEAAQILLLACAKFLKAKVSDGESFIGFVADNGDRIAAVQKLAVLMKDMPPSSTSSSGCDECQRKRTECLDDKSVTGDNVKVGVKVVRKKRKSNDSKTIGEHLPLAKKIFMSKDGKVIGRQIAYVEPSQQQKLAPPPVVTPGHDIKQKVQIVKAADGKIQVRGLRPGQQLVQRPDGKLQIFNQSPSNEVEDAME